LARARAFLAAAETDAAATKQAAAEEGERVRAAAEAEAATQTERATRRVADAEEGARIVRENVTAEVEKMQREAFTRNRASREEAVALLTKARSDADSVREEARLALERARTEVAGLARRRDDIVAQLGHLSGVIDALAVTERPNPSDAEEAQS
ncbi:MAG TPA: kinetoplast-associated-like protein, partial [Propionibacteriaceae bacterium]|nr:kinetoplast-associated-like protein [Propionibacteriaceae bacterium]